MKFKRLNEEFEVGNKMTITIGSGVNADGCKIVITDEAGGILFKEDYHYGYNASYNRKFASFYPDQPFIGDIVNELCTKFNINKDDITYEKGTNLFRGTKTSDEQVARFIALMNEERSGVKESETHLNHLLEKRVQEYLTSAKVYVGEQNYSSARRMISNALDIIDNLDKKETFKESVATDSTLKRISSYGEFDNGHVFRDWKKMTFAEAEEEARKASIENPDDVYYVAYDNIMDSSSDYVWVNGKQFKSSNVILRGNKPYIKNDDTNESFEMAVGGDDFDGEIAAMRDEQKDLEKRRAGRKERFALMHKLFDKHMNNDPNGRWIDKIYDLFDEAESVTFIGDKYSLIPSRTEDDQPVRYRYSEKEYDFYTDPYREIVYIATNNNDPLAEDLEDDFNLLMVASDYKCKLRRYDLEEMVDEQALLTSIKLAFAALNAKYGDDMKYWRFYEGDDADGYKVFFNDGTTKIVDIDHEEVINMEESVERGTNTDPVYFNPDEEFEIDFRYYVYDSNDEVVSDGFEFEDDAIEWAQDNGYPVVKIHNYYRDNDDQLNPDGDPEIIWHS